MKRSQIILVLLLAIIISCEKEATIQPKDYPYVLTKDVVDNNPTGVTLVAEVLDFCKEDIIDYGFIWMENENEYKQSLLNKTTIEDFRLRISSGLEKGGNYSYKAYVQTTDCMVLGNAISFKSLGSLSPRINSFTPNFGPIGTQVAIEGENFAISKSGNIVKFGNITVIVDSVSENRLVVTIPKITKPEKVNITVETAGMFAASVDSFDLWFPWLPKSDYSSVYYGSTSFSIEHMGCVINRSSFNMLKYNSIDDVWQNNINLPESSGDMPLAFASNGKGYALLSSGFWEYNPLSNSWIRKADFPGTVQRDKNYVFGMSIEDNIYIGNCYGTYEFWQYDIIQDSWQRKADFIGDFDMSSPVWGNYAFSIYGKGFLGISQTGFALNSLWEYDPKQDLWSSKSPLPSYSYRSYCCFVINEEPFVGLGNNFDWSDGYVSNEIWKYDYYSDKWVKYHNCPVSMAVNTSFSINEKAYIVSSYTRYYDDLDNVWEFDPSKN